jgi:hypothetical protein
VLVALTVGVLVIVTVDVGVGEDVGVRVGVTVAVDVLVAVAVAGGLIKLELAVTWSKATSYTRSVEFSPNCRMPTAVVPSASVLVRELT